MTPHRATTEGWAAYFLGERAPPGLTPEHRVWWERGWSMAVELHREQRRWAERNEQRRGRGKVE